MEFIFSFINLFAQVLTIAIFGRAILSWFPISPDNPLVVIMHQITEPILAPLRRVIPRLGMIDITPFIAILLLQGLSVTVQSL
ncbi:MAG: YggT family protein [Chloroflexi bacterium]|nr:YggT family protein [Chloroflexota bacterium]